MHKRRWIARSVVFPLLLVLCSSLLVQLQPALAASDRDSADLSIATYNLYLGADLTSLLAAHTQDEFMQRAGEAYAQVQKTNFPSCAEHLAELIVRNGPDVIGLQEVAFWQTGPIDGNMTTSYDFLQILLGALAERGSKYEAVATNTNFSAVAPISPTARMGFTDRDVILVRSQPFESLRVKATESHNFVSTLVVPAPVPGGTVTIERGWSDIDVTQHRRTLRIVNTHLEAFDSKTRVAQATELRAALASSSRPVVLVGDLNSTPDAVSDPYGIVTSSGFTDAWVLANGPEGGFTAGQASDLMNMPSRIDHRIDYVLYQPRHVEAERATVIGDDLRDRTPEGLWPSDHAGVGATLEVDYRGLF